MVALPSPISARLAGLYLSICLVDEDKAYPNSSFMKMKRTSLKQRCSFVKAKYVIGFFQDPRGRMQIHRVEYLTELQ
jgi:hypothetical protein